MKLTASDAGVAVSAEALAAAEALADPDHDCGVYRETATYPTPDGRITVTGHCTCGRVMSVEQDRIL